MNINELQIGDFVYVFDTVKQVEGTRKFANGDEVVYYDGDNANFITNVKPIPITTEFLEKNEFKKRGDGYWLDRPIHYAAYGKVTIKPIGALSAGVMLWDFEPGCLSHGEGRVFIQYVHELQHALKMFGFEKKEIIA